jgi:hypothetical protein
MASTAEKKGSWVIEVRVRDTPAVKDLDALDREVTSCDGTSRS